MSYNIRLYATNTCADCNCVNMCVCVGVCALVCVCVCVVTGCVEFVFRLASVTAH